MWLPAVEKLVGKVQVPEASMQLPMVAKPSLKVMEPVGVPGPVCPGVAETVAVRVVEPLMIDGLMELARPVCEVYWLTTCVICGEVTVE